MNVMTMTFHWASNYGAVLQAYALQRFIQTNIAADSVKIVDYIPDGMQINVRNVFRSKRPAKILARLKELRKEAHLIKFRQEHLQMTQHFGNLSTLRNECPDTDIIICGSDQIWNEGFTAHGEGDFTPSYFLDFGRESSKRIAYAASFGQTDYPADLTARIKPLLDRFYAISSREKSGVELLQHMGYQDARLTVDPVLLLPSVEYEKLIVSAHNYSKQASLYMLRRQDKATKQLLHNIKYSLPVNMAIKSIDGYKVEDWLSALKTSGIVITNSFHAMVFCFIFHTPFYVLLEHGELSGMNDRITTFLQMTGLENRIINDADSFRIDDEIVWEKASPKLQPFIDESKQFLINSLSCDQ